MSELNYVEIARKVVDNAGGAGNIKRVYHCMSRLRLPLNDPSRANTDDLKDLMRGAIINGKELQVICGEHIYKVYDEVSKIYEAEAPNAEKIEEVAEKRSAKTVAMDILGGISKAVFPVMMAIIGCGMVKTLYVILSTIGVLSPESMTYRVLEFIGDSGFYFLPILVGYQTAKNNDANPLLGMIVGAMMLHPTFVSMVNAGEKISVFGLPIQSATYSSTILPAYFAVLAMCPIEKWIAKKSPDSLRVILEPTLTIFAMIPLTFCLIAPFSNWLTAILGGVINWIYAHTGFLAPVIFGVACPFLVMLGLHMSLGPIGMVTLMEKGRETVLFPGAVLLHNLVHGALSLGIMLKSKNKETKGVAFSGMINGWLAGISEISLYGLCLKYRAAMYALIAGQFAGSLYYGITNVGLIMFGGGGFAFMSVLMFIEPGNPSNFINACIGTVIGMAVAFIVAYLLFKDETSES